MNAVVQLSVSGTAWNSKDKGLAYIIVKLNTTFITFGSMVCLLSIGSCSQTFVYAGKQMERFPWHTGSKVCFERGSYQNT